MGIFGPDKDWRTCMVEDVAPAIDDGLGAEPLTIIPARPAKPNESRRYEQKAAWHCRGIFNLRSELVKLGLEETKVSSRNPWFSISYAELGDRSIRHMDQIVVERTGDHYEVIGTSPDGVSRTKVNVVQIGRAADR